ncbi:MAG: GntR family transcriptional regulator [Beijerinckiaceae bacterium]
MTVADDLAFKPLYQQVREKLTRRIAEGSWRGGEIVPSEMQIAAELGVSQGTVRKALDEMTTAKLLLRKQGIGTFVATHDEARILFQFFKLMPDSGEQVFPESVVLSVETGAADEVAAERLALFKGEPVIRICRVRSIGTRKAISETIIVPLALFDGLQDAKIPNNLYQLYADRYGVRVAGGRETLKAVAASAKDSVVLGIKQGTPLLVIDRVAIALDGRPVEWRVSLCETSEVHYATELS